MKCKAILIAPSTPPFVHLSTYSELRGKVRVAISRTGHVRKVKNHLSAEKWMEIEKEKAIKQMRTKVAFLILTFMSVTSVTRWPDWPVAKNAKVSMIDNCQKWINP